MSSGQPARPEQQQGREYYYTVLNLPTAASQDEINERHRALSLVFHPDKQRDEELKETASKQFLKIQKAYEVLSDPFLRRVYDVLGESGLSMNWPPVIRAHSREKLDRVLYGLKYDLAQIRAGNALRPTGGITCGFDASSLFEEGYVPEGWSVYDTMKARLEELSLTSFSVRHAVQRQVTPKTKLLLATRMGQRSPEGGSKTTYSAAAVGTVRHQYSPRLFFEANADLLRPTVSVLKGTYRAEGGILSVQTYFSPIFVRDRTLPPVTISYSRQLFLNWPTQGAIEATLGPAPTLTVNLVSPHNFSFLPLTDPLAPLDEDVPPGAQSDSDIPNGPAALPTPGSLGPFKHGTTYSSYGLTLAGPRTALRGEVGVTFPEIGLSFKATIGAPLVYLGSILEAYLTTTWEWGPADGLPEGELVVAGQGGGSVSASVGLAPDGVVLKLDVSYSGQQLHVPITLSHDYNPKAALWTLAVPTSAWVVWYNLVIKPRRRVKRTNLLREARYKAQRPDEGDREREKVLAILRDTARRNTRTETARSGLVIIEATYGPIEQGEELRDLIADVTVPLQALVHNSQLSIPSGRSKADLQGFFDPLPNHPKIIRVSYEFRGRQHYAEVPDHAPVVLPLAEHLVR